MGRRSINTTKSGKYMNPTDQARKEARKKELKKNKRQRQMVRAAVLKNKDPAQILEEMEKIDEMEYNVLQPSPLNEKVLRDKRKKLKDTFDRVMRLYHNDEPEHWAELKRKEVEYEKKRLKKQQYYESVKHAQTVQIDEIPLPSATPTPAANATVVPGDASGVTFSKSLPPPDTLTMPPFANTTTLGGIKKPGELLQSQAVPAGAATTKKSDVIGVPPSPPPDILAMSDLDTDAEDDEVTLKEYNPKKAKKTLPVPNSLQQRMLAISGQNLDDFMKEMESVHKRKQRERSDRRDHSDSEDERDRSRSRRISKDRRHSSSADSDSEDEKNHKHRRRSRSKSPARSHNPLHDATNTNLPATNLPPMSAPMHAMPAPNAFPPLPTLTAGGVPQVPGMGPAALLFRPPPLRPAGGMPRFGMRLPIGPPGSRPPNMGNMPPRMGIRMPPGPPPGLPPRMQHHHKNANKQDIAGKGVTTITAKPQIRNLSADVTRFVPSTLRVKREEVRKPNRTKTSFATETKVKQVAEANKAATKDDAYLQFMNEMQDLL